MSLQTHVMRRGWEQLDSRVMINTDRAYANSTSLCTNAVQGVTIYISDFTRSITDRLAKDFFDEPSQVMGDRR